MGRTFFFFLATVICCLFWGRPADSATRTISSTRQFIVESDDPQLSLTISVYAERLKAAILAKLQLQDRWRSVVHISIHANETGSLSNSIVLLPYELGGQLHFTLRTQVPPPLNQSEFFRAISQVLCAELVNRPRENVRAGDKLIVVPLWFSEGLWQSVADGAVGVPVDETNRKLLQRAVKVGLCSTWAQLRSTEQLPTDAVTAQLFGAQSQVLLDSLLSLPDGQQKIQKFLASIAITTDWRDAFFATYAKDFHDEAMLEKWWSLCLQKRSESRTLQTLSARETQLRLETILTMRIGITQKEGETPVIRTLRVSELGDYWKLPGFNSQLDQKILELALFLPLSYPTFRKVIAVYQDALLSLRQRQFRRFLRTVSRAEKLRAQVIQQAQDVADYLNDLEARQQLGLAVSLRSFFLPMTGLSSVPAGGSISSFLDRIEASRRLDGKREGE